MKYLKLATIVVTLLAVLGMTAFGGATKKTAAERKLLMQKSSEDLIKVKHAARTSHKAAPKLAIEKGVSGAREAFAVSAPKNVQLTKSGTVPPSVPLSGLSGTYQVGSGYGIGNLSVMALILNVASVSGPVVFELTDPSYTEAGIAIGPTAGASSTNTITIRPAAGNTSCVITLTDNTSNGGGLVLSGAEHLTIEGTAVGALAGSRNLTVQLSATPSVASDAPVKIYNSHSVTVSDCIIPGNVVGAAWFNGNGSVSIIGVPGGNNLNITVNNCELYGGKYGVLELGNFMLGYDYYGIQDDYTTVSNCYIHNVDENGINLQQVSDAVISHNIVKRVSLPAGAGAPPELFFTTDSTPPTGVVGHAYPWNNYPLIHRPSGITLWGDFATLDGNLVDSVYNNRTSSGTMSGSAYGIRVIGFGNNDPDPIYGGSLSMAGYPTWSMVKNNIITRVFSQAVQSNLPFHVIGLQLQSGRWDTVVHNTVYLSGTEAGLAHSGPNFAFEIEGTTTTNYGLPGWTALLGVEPINIFSHRAIVRDNIFAIDRAGTSGSNVIIATQNALSPSLNSYAPDYRAGSDYNVLFMNSPGVIAYTSQDQSWQTLYDFQNTYVYAVDAHSQADDPTLVSASDAHISPTGYSSADGAGATYNGVNVDFDGVTRANPPDIGALEGTGLGAPHDVRILSLDAPGAAGAPAGLPFSTFSATILNLTPNTETSVPINIHIVSPSLVTADFPGTFNINPSGLAHVDVAGPWTPPEGGNYTFTVTLNLASDVNRNNDTLVVTVPVAALQTVPYASGFENAGERDGWFWDGEFGLATTGATGGGATHSTKLGGAHGGSLSLVTVPGAPGDVYSGATASHAYSPYFDLTTMASNTYIQLYHSIQTEPGWDQSVVEYTIDTGKTWHVLGALNEPNGINWYKTSVYQNAITHWVADTCFDTSTAKTVHYPADDPGHPSRCWSSNGECGATGAETDPTGPDGYVLVAMKLNGSPVDGHTYVRFRYTAFSDALTTYDGWAIDDFGIGSLTLPGAGNLSGTVFNDINGDGTLNGADAGLASTKVYLTYFGTVTDSTTTDGSGNYTFTGGLVIPGTYSVFTSVTTFALSTAAPTANWSSGNVTGMNIGYYDGSISGIVYNDVNSSGTADGGETGLSGWTVEVHADSSTGELVTSATTNGSGAYTAYVLPGTYVVKAVQQTFYRPAGAETLVVNVSGDGGTGTAVKTGVNLFEYKKGKYTLYFATDLNGSGTIPPAAILGMPAGVKGFFTTYRNGAVYRTDTLGDFNAYGASLLMSNVDTGHYVVKMTNFNFDPGWYNHSPADSVTFNYSTADATGAGYFIGYQLATFNGRVYEDSDGNGTKNGSEAGIAGWQVTMSGTNPDTTTTDADGKWTFSGIYPGLHTVTVHPAAGYQVSPATRNFTPNSGATTNDSSFAGFKLFTVSGNVYRDRDNSGSQNAGDTPLSSVTVTLSKTNAPTSSTNTTSDGSGNYSFANVGPGDYSVSITVPSGYGQTEPVPATPTHDFTAASGADQTGLLFGAFQLTDAALYRTLTAADFAALSPKIKPAKGTKADTIGNLANMLNDVNAVLAVGIPSASKTVAYFQPKKYSDVVGSFVGPHTGTPSGFDFTVKGKLMVKRLTKISPAVQNNVLFANLLALNVNVALSDNGNLPIGLGSLVINDGGTYDGMSINNFLNAADSFMTNWRKIPQSTYDEANTLAANINAAFSGAISLPSYHGTGKVTLPGVATVYSTSFLHPATSVVPRNHPPVDVDVAPFVPQTYALFQNYPNPFNPTTTIRFDLPFNSVVTVKIYNMLGQEVATLIDHEEMEAARVDAPFNANGLASGVYFYRVVAEKQNDNGAMAGETFTKVMKMSLVK